MADSAERRGTIDWLLLPNDALIKLVIGRKVVMPRASIRSTTSGRDLSITGMHKCPGKFIGVATDGETGNKNGQFGSSK